ncbi:MAG: glutamine--fructose-6-phosphate transaminase (isomerizing) [Lentisphaerae bacterium]|nr:glutamine--fructose-6-phosphate transaminase (isomerizing) [Lentisphaerota bacterium]
MCGIVGYIGSRPAADIVVSGLKKLEYRGYDSAGLAVLDPAAPSIGLFRAVGKIAELDKAIASHPPASTCTVGIGHTRWATHGAPTVANAHPHLSMDGRIAVVHNGIIENYLALRSRLESKGYVFKSETDTEVLAHLIQDCLDGGLAESVMRALVHVEGTYGIAVVSSDFPGVLVAARKGSPIVIGDCRGEAIVASDVSAIIQHTDKVVFLDDGDVAVLTPEGAELRTLGNSTVSRSSTVVDWDPGAIEKGGFEHFMLKEIFEQPEAIANTIRGRLLLDDGTCKLSGLQLDPQKMAEITNIVVTACGTSYYAGLVGSYAFEQFAGIPARIEQAAEFRYRNPIIAPNTALVSISQSGETADTLAAVREAKRKGALTLSICNVVGSTIAREAGRGVYLHAGPEIGVASTKAFICQVAVLDMMAIMLGRTRRMSNSEGTTMVAAMLRLPEIVKRVLEQNDAIRAIAEKYHQARDFFYIGRGYMFPAALEGALKLKEISYIHAEGYHAAELKHGPIALLDEHVPVVACVPQIPGHRKTLGNVQECRARRAPVIAIATEGDPDIGGLANDVISIPECPEFIAPIPVVVAEQLFAYHMANLRGEPIDQPRNLAKSVTVE